MEINKSEVLRYLGYKNQVIELRLDKIIDSCIEEMKDIAIPRSVYKVFDVEILEDGVYLKEYGILLKGKDIREHLKNSRKCAILASTIGVTVDNRIRYLNKSDVTSGIILDSCATEAIEGTCNDLEAEIREIAKKENLNINFRYSPGYGDFGLEVQPIILKLLNAEKKIGLTCTESYILIPRKSVTAIIGFIEEGEYEVKSSCERCKNYNNCLYRREGLKCGF